MTAIFRGAEDINFSPVGGPTVDTIASHFRAGYGRCALFAQVFSFQTDLLQPAWRIPSSYSLSSSNFWFSGRLFGFGVSGKANYVLRFLSAGDVPRFAIGGGGGLTGVTLTNFTGAGTPTLLATGSPLAVGSLQKIDVNVSYGATGTVNVYADGTLILSYTGSLATDGTTAITGIDLGSGSWSEIIWDTSDTRSMSLVTLAPNGAGVSQQWTGTFSDVNAIVNADNTFNYTLSANQTQLYPQNGMPTGSFTVFDFTLSVRAASQAGSPQHLLPAVFTGGGQHNNSAWSLGVSLAPYFSIWTANPATSAAWTVSDINGLQEGFESQA